VKIEKGRSAGITREGFEYELTINLEMDLAASCTASKDRTNLFMGKAPSFLPKKPVSSLPMVRAGRRSL
jgi:hypothetical protein